ncbi:MAG: hypothetical protein H8E66_07725 [Planctomycetes bacterium]|nr:hypothetical protein [Planctomycetota bacterium]
MNRSKQVTLGLVCTLTIVGAYATLKKPIDKPNASPPTLEIEDLPSQSQQPVGWVFGRMAGVPGADRPLTSASGSLGGNASLPMGHGR